MTDVGKKVTSRRSVVSHELCVGSVACTALATGTTLSSVRWIAGCPQRLSRGTRQKEAALYVDVGLTLR